jgi:hypothetical protein
VLLIAGIIMLVTPGQGIISILLGLFLMEFPGKRKLELKLINHEPTFKHLIGYEAKPIKTHLIDEREQIGSYYFIDHLCDL